MKNVFHGLEILGPPKSCISWVIKYFSWSIKFTNVPNSIFMNHEIPMEHGEIIYGFRRERLQGFATFDSLLVQRDLEAR